MTNVSAYVYKDGDKFYFDPENYSGDINKNLSIGFEDGDMIRWDWEGTKMSGVLREEMRGINLFVIKNPRIIG
jgi:hypothetical protein